MKSPIYIFRSAQLPRSLIMPMSQTGNRDAISSHNCCRILWLIFGWLFEQSKTLAFQGFRTFHAWPWMCKLSAGLDEDG